MTTKPRLAVRARGDRAPSADVMRHQWALLKMLPREPRYIDTPTLAERLLTEHEIKIPLRTLQRTLKSLVGPFSIKLDETHKPFRWSWKKDAPMFSLPGLDEPSALLVLLVERHLRAALPPALEQSFTGLAEAARDALAQDGNKLKDWLDAVKIVPRFFPLVPPNADDGVVDAAAHALLNKRKLAISYRGRNDARRREMVVNPHGLIIRDGAIYLYATEDEALEPRAFALHRAHSAHVLEEACVERKKPNMDEAAERLAFAFSEEPVRVTLRFAKEVSRIPLETPIAKSQTLQVEADESVVVSAVVRDTQQFRAWLLGFGTTLEVLSPPGLRKWMADTAREMSRAHGAPRRRRIRATN